MTKKNFLPPEILGHPVKLMDNRFRADKRKYYFAKRVIKKWNLLPKDVAIAAV